jgi:MoxR-like ATPase
VTASDITAHTTLESVGEVRDLLEAQRYVVDRQIATSVYLAMRLGRPILIEGEAGVGKTEIAKALAAALRTELIRLQCYEGLDAGTALYEWNYPKQLLRIKMEEQEAHSVEEKEAIIFGRSFLLARPLLRAITAEERAPVLLIDEIDRADEEFEAFLLEVLSDFQVTIPELGTIAATHRPHVILTSNRTRELSDALKRRCLYLWIPYPDLDKEVRIIEQRIPGVAARLATEVARVMHRLRELDLNKTPGVAETLDWTLSIMTLHRDHLDPEVVEDTLGVVLKDRDDLEAVAPRAVELLAGE